MGVVAVVVGVEVGADFHRPPEEEQNFLVEEVGIHLLIDMVIR